MTDQRFSLTNSALAKHLKKLKPIVGYIFVFSFFVNLLLLVPPLYMLNVFDRVLSSRSLETLTMLTLIMVFLLVAFGCLEWSRQVLTQRMGGRFHELMSDRIFDLSFQQALLEPGNPNSQLMQDIQGLRGYISGRSLLTFFDLPWTPVFVAILFMFHPYFGYLTIFGMAVLFFVTWLSERANAKKTKEAELKSGKATAYAARTILNAEVAHSMGMVEQIKKRWHDKSLDATKEQTEVGDVAGIYRSISRTFRMILQSALLGMGAYLVVKSEITTGMIIAGSILGGRALTPIDQLVSGWNGLLLARARAQRLNSALEVPFNKHEEDMSLPKPEGRLSLENVVVLAPRTNKAVLKNITFTMAVGSHFGVFGPSGAGKSTLAKAILGLWPVSQGVVRLDAADISKWNRNRLGPYLGYLPQDIELFDGTIAENISRFQEMEPKEVVAAARRARVHELILSFQDGYDTHVSQLGGIITGGQKQRLGLARAIYKMPRLIVLDEPNANLDQEGEIALISLIKELKAEKVTLVVIAHRPNILVQLDNIIVMNKGMITDFGNSETILKKHLQVVKPPEALPSNNSPNKTEAKS